MIPLAESASCAKSFSLQLDQSSSCGVVSGALCRGAGLQSYWTTGTGSVLCAHPMNLQLLLLLLQLRGAAEGWLLWLRQMFYPFLLDHARCLSASTLGVLHLLLGSVFGVCLSSRLSQ